MAGARVLPALLVALALGALAASASAATFDDRDTFLTQTGATSATGELPNLGAAGAVVALGSVTFDTNPNTTCCNHGKPRDRLRVRLRRADRPSAVQRPDLRRLDVLAHAQARRDDRGFVQLQRPRRRRRVRGRQERLPVRQGRDPRAVRCRCDAAPRLLETIEAVEIGCVVDARRGAAELTSSKGKGRGTQSARFWAGLFRIGQKRGKVEVTLKLVGELNCGKRWSARGSAAAELSRKRGRRLWGRGKGRYRTIGAHGSAGVRGTTWLVADRCDNSTLFRVRQGVVSVRDFAKHKTLTLSKGQRYIANRRERR